MGYFALNSPTLPCTSLGGEPDIINYLPVEKFVKDATNWNHWLRNAGEFYRGLASAGRPSAPVAPNAQFSMPCKGLL